MDEKMLEEFAKEMEILEAIINRYIAGNPVLSFLELDTLKLVNKFDASKLNARALSNTASAENHTMRSCKICKDENGNLYCYYGLNGCP